MKKGVVLKEEKERQNRLARSKYLAHRSFAMRCLLARQNSFIYDHISPDQSILEIGCGVGDFLSFALQKGIRRVVGIDVSEQCVAFANERLKKEGFPSVAQVGDVYRLSESIDERAAFDSVIMRGIVHHLEYPAAAFRNVLRVMKSGGTLVILEGNTAGLYRKTVLAIADLLKITHEASQFSHRSPAFITDTLKKVGFCRILSYFIPTAFAPFAYQGLGGPFFWRIAEIFDDKIFSRVGHGFFNWWVLLVATKPGCG